MCHSVAPIAKLRDDLIHARTLCNCCLRVVAVAAVAIPHPIGPPLPRAPPCILQRPFPFAAGDRQGFPRRVCAPHRGASRKAVGSWVIRSIGSSTIFFASPTPAGDVTDNRLAPRMDVDVLNPHSLLAPAAHLGQSLDLQHVGAQYGVGSASARNILPDRGGGRFRMSL